MLPDTIHDRLFQRATAAVTRRSSLRALGGAALAATTVALPDRVAARKKRKGKTCQDRERQRCANDADACKATALGNCPVQGTCGYALICCEECTATGFYRCALDTV
jgi:hypothetical protein